MQEYCVIVFISGSEEQFCHENNICRKGCGQRNFMFPKQIAEILRCCNEIVYLPQFYSYNYFVKKWVFFLNQSHITVYPFQIEILSFKAQIRYSPRLRLA